MSDRSDHSLPARPADPPSAPVLDATLNPAQRQAIEAIDGAVLVLAGAGTGKTRVLTSRLAQILVSRRASPGQILAVTFTNKAAREMRERVAGLIGAAVEGVWLGTFHALGARILRRHAEVVGLKPSFTILDTDDQLRLLKQVLQVENVDAQRWPARVLLAIIQRWKDRGLTPEKVTAAEAGDFAAGRAVKLYRDYQDRLRTLNAADFGDLLLHCLTLFGQRGDVLEDYQRRFKYILVDEYQDTNVAQYLWLRLLAQGQRNICCVGDDDQSIYGWRGAEVGNILRFERDFPGARVVRLEQNYRSTGRILAAASGLIAHNEGRLGKTLWTEGEEGDRIAVLGVWDGEEEARVVADEIEALQRRGEALAETAILVRAGFQTREFEERFLTLGIPYRVIGGPRFYERREVRDAVAYLRVIAQPDDGLAFERIVNLPRRGIGETTMRTVHTLARAQGLSLTEAARRLVETDELKPRARRALADLLHGFERWSAAAEALPPAELAATVLDESGYTAMWQDDRSAEAPGRLDNLKELVAALEEFDTLAGFLEHVSLVMETAAQAGGEVVSLMTVHSAKGLEFDTVFLPGWEEGLFPHPRALNEGGLKSLEEERRLAYVALTRARKRAVISHAANRRVNSMWQSAVPSRFVEELPAEHVEVTAAPGLYGGAATDASMPDRFAPAAGLARAAPAASPGWRGAARGGPRLIEGRAEARPSGGNGRGYAVGARVFHSRFGYGTVAAVDGDRLEIAFDGTGAKRVMSSFVEPA